MEDEALVQRCCALLIDWCAAVRRPLPWRLSPTPYHVWVSEIMLQQTRIEAVIPYYARFLEALPDVAALAEAEEDRLLKLWEGLGYYSRARNLQKAARRVMADFGGELPRSAKELRSLPGIGAYTAGAIASIAWGEPEPAVDGNVLRVMTRVLACPDDVLLPKTREHVAALLRGCYPRGERAGLLTEGIMELGETVCLPPEGAADRGADGPATGLRRALCRAEAGGKGPSRGALGVSESRRRAGRGAGRGGDQSPRRGAPVHHPLRGGKARLHPCGVAHAGLSRRAQSGSARLSLENPGGDRRRVPHPDRPAVLSEEAVKKVDGHRRGRPPGRPLRYSQNKKKAFGEKVHTMVRICRRLILFYDFFAGRSRTPAPTGLISDCLNRTGFLTVAFARKGITLSP